MFLAPHFVASMVLPAFVSVSFPVKYRIFLTCAAAAGMHRREHRRMRRFYFQRTSLSFGRRDVLS
jgi:hypothetical protein